MGNVTSTIMAKLLSSLILKKKTGNGDSDDRLKTSEGLCKTSYCILHITCESKTRNHGLQKQITNHVMVPARPQQLSGWSSSHPTTHQLSSKVMVVDYKMMSV